MKLLYDIRATQPSGLGKRHGGGRYGEVIFTRMAMKGLEFGCFYDSRMWLNPDTKALAEEKGLKMHDVSERSLQEIVDQEGYDRVYSCLLRKDVAGLERCEVYATIHGLRQFETPYDHCFWDYKYPSWERFKFLIKEICPKVWYKWEVWKFRRKVVDNGKVHFVAVSEHTRHAVKAFFPEMKDRDLEVFYSPNTSENTAKTSKPLSRSGKGEKYFLAVSGNRWEKNNLRAIKAFDRLVGSGLIEGVRMKVTGVKSPDIFRYKIKNPEAFDLLGYVSDEELEKLYSEAYLFVYPSLNEGFGYPPLEAMRYGVPVIASPLSSIPEVLDSAALYFNPFLVEEIMGRMMMMMDKDRHEAYSERAKAQYKKISKRQESDLEGIINHLME